MSFGRFDKIVSTTGLTVGEELRWDYIQRRLAENKQQVIFLRRFRRAARERFGR